MRTALRIAPVPGSAITVAIAPERPPQRAPPNVGARPARDLWKWVRVFREFGPDKLSKLVLFALASRMRPDYLKAYPSHATIARDCSMSRRQVMRCVENLVGIGWLIQHQSRSKNGRRWLRNTYIAAYPAGYNEDALQINNIDQENW